MWLLVDNIQAKIILFSFLVAFIRVMAQQFGRLPLPLLLTE